MYFTFPGIFEESVRDTCVCVCVCVCVCACACVCVRDLAVRTARAVEGFVASASASVLSAVVGVVCVLVRAVAYDVVILSPL